MNMATQPVTTDDLQVLKEDLLKAFDSKLKEWQPGQAGKWLRTNELVRFLRLAPSTLQTMRNNGILPYTKLGNVIFYDAAEVRRMLEKKSKPRSTPPKGSSKKRKRL